MREFKSGVGLADITPPVGLPMMGYSEKERDVGNTGIHDPLYAKALVLSDGDCKIAIVNCDLAGFDLELSQKIQNLVESNSDILGRNVLLGCTHTHCGPIGTIQDQRLEPLLERFKPYFSFVQHLREVYAWQIAGTVIEANNRLTKSKIGTEPGNLKSGAICTNRNNPEGPMDPEVLVMRTDSHLMAPQAILANYSCHPTVISYKSMEISADYPGYAMKFVEQAFPGTQAMYSNGAEGDISTRWSRREQTFKEAERIGRIFASEIVKTAAQIETKEEVTIKAISKEIELPLKKLPNLEEAKKIVEEKTKELNKLKQEGASHGAYRRAYTTYLGSTFQLEYVKAGALKSMGGKIKTFIQAFSVNDTGIVSIPGEMFTNLQLKIKKSSPFDKTFVIGLANDYIGYILDSEIYDKNIYESWTTILARNAGDQLTDESLKLLASLNE